MRVRCSSVGRVFFTTVNPAAWIPKFNSDLQETKIDYYANSNEQDLQEVYVNFEDGKNTNTNFRFYQPSKQVDKRERWASDTNGTWNETHPMLKWSIFHAALAWRNWPGDFTLSRIIWSNIWTWKMTKRTTMTSSTVFRWRQWTVIFQATAISSSHKAWSKQHFQTVANYQWYLLVRFIAIHL